MHKQIGVIAHIIISFVLKLMGMLKL